MSLAAAQTASLALVDSPREVSHQGFIIISWPCRSTTCSPLGLLKRIHVRSRGSGLKGPQVCCYGPTTSTCTRTRQRSWNAAARASLHASHCWACPSGHIVWSNCATDTAWALLLCSMTAFASWMRPSRWLWASYLTQGVTRTSLRGIENIVRSGSCRRTGICFAHNICMCSIAYSSDFARQALHSYIVQGDGVRPWRWRTTATARTARLQGRPWCRDDAQGKHICKLRKCWHCRGQQRCASIRPVHVGVASNSVTTDGLATSPRDHSSLFAPLLTWRDQLWWRFKQASLRSNHYDEDRHRSTSSAKPWETSLVLHIAADWKEKALDRTAGTSHV